MQTIAYGWIDLHNFIFLQNEENLVQYCAVLNIIHGRYRIRIRWSRSAASAFKSQYWSRGFLPPAETIILRISLSHQTWYEDLLLATIMRRVIKWEDCRLLFLVDKNFKKKYLYQQWEIVYFLLIFVFLITDIQKVFK